MHCYLESGPLTARRSERSIGVQGKIAHFANFGADLGRYDELVEATRLPVLLKQMHIFAVHVLECRVVERDQLTTESWQQRQSTRVEHEDHEGVVFGPGDVINLQVCFSFLVRRRRVVRSHKLEKLHVREKRCLQVGEDYLAETHVHTVNNSHH